MRGGARRRAAMLLVAACGVAVAASGDPPAATGKSGAAPAEAAATQDEAAGRWRAARWGMSVEEVLKAFPGEAARLDPQVELTDGNTVAVGLPDQVVAGQPLLCRMVFAGGRLALVSLRTPQRSYAGDRVYDRIREHLRGRLGPPAYAVAEEPFVEQRQTRWVLKDGVVDLKAIPGTVVLMYSAPPAPAAR